MGKIIALLILLTFLFCCKKIVPEEIFTDPNPIDSSLSTINFVEYERHEVIDLSYTQNGTLIERYNLIIHFNTINFDKLPDSSRVQSIIINSKKINMNLGRNSSSFYNITRGTRDYNFGLFFTDNSSYFQKNNIEITVP